MYTKSRLEEALLNKCNKTKQMMANDIVLPQIINTVVVDIFLNKIIEDNDIEVIREALKDLKEIGKFNFKDEIK